MAVTNKTFADLITFTRSGATATRVNSAGLIETVAADTPRFDYDPVTGAAKGLLIEEARTNLLPQSEEFDSANWGKSSATVTANATTAPDGTVSADLITQTAAGGRVTRSVTAPLTGNYSYSVFIKKSGGNDTVRILLRNSTTSLNYYADFTFSSASFAQVHTNTTASYEAHSGGWFRVIVTADTAFTASDTLTAYVYGGAGHSSSESVYAWGAQLEAGAFASSYIPTKSTFTSRASTATYFDSEGVLQTAAINEARTGYKLINGTWTSMGLLLEAAATNLLVRSEEFNTSSWIKVRASVTADATTAPDGTATADKLVEDSTASNDHWASQTVTTTAAPHTFSFYAKAAERSWLGILMQDSGAVYRSAYYNLSAGTIGNVGAGVTASIEDVGGGWFRCSYVINAALAGSNQARIYLATGDGVFSYTGDGSSGVYLWGAQLEEGTYATSYIPTTSATVTRSADVSSSSTVTRPADNASITGTDFSDWYNASEGTVYCEFTYGATDSGQAGYPYYISDGTGNNRISVVKGSADTIIFSVTQGGVGQVGITPTGGTGLTNGQTFKTAFAFKNNDCAASIDGAAVSVDASATLPSVSRMDIGSALTTTGHAGAHIRDIRFYPTRLSNTELQELTS